MFASDSLPFTSFYSKLWEFCLSPVCSLLRWAWLANAAVWLFMSLSPHGLPFPVCPLSVLWLVWHWAVALTGHPFNSDVWLLRAALTLAPLSFGALEKATSYSVPLWEFGCTKGFLAPQLLHGVYSYSARVTDPHRGVVSWREGSWRRGENPKSL